MPTPTKAAKTQRNKRAKEGKASKSRRVSSPKPGRGESAQVLSSVVTFECPLFRVHHDTILNPGGNRVERDLIRHNGSVVILAVDNTKSSADPWIVIERQYRHAAGQFLWELPAGTLDSGEEPLAGAKRELEEETGYQAKQWRPLVEYFASPGFLGETMKVFVAEGLIAGQARPEEDEQIEFRLVHLSDVLRMIEKGRIKDGKTLSSVLLYSRLLSHRGKK